MKQANSEWRIANSVTKNPIRHSLFAIRLSPKSHRPDFDHVGHEMPEQVLDAVLQRRGGGRAAGARTLHVEIDDTVLEAAEGDVTPAIGDSRRHPGLAHVLDSRDR